MAKYRFDQVARECRTTFKGDKNGMPIVGLEHLVPNEMLVRDFEVDTENTFTKSFKQGQILFGRRRAYQQKAGVAQFDGICSGDITVIEAIPGKIEPNLLPFIVQNEQFFEHAVQGSAGSLSPRVKWEHLASYEIELPTMEKQRVLADKLWTAYRLKESYKKLLAATDEMVKSQFIEMFGNPLSDVQKYGLKKLGECCELNPRHPRLNLEDSDMVSFVPMPSVSENGHLVDVADEEYGKVKKGFTYFENNDVLFAKITPCMENGKGTIAQDLTNGIGMGSTEFHVLRPINNISNAYWLLALTRMPIFRERASKNMSGTGGQKRVGAAFLENFLVGLPPIGEQQAFEAIYKQADKSKFVGFKSQFIEMFGDPMTNTKGWTEYGYIGNYSQIVLGSTPNSKNPSYWDGDIKWITPAEMTDESYYIYDTERHLTEEGLRSANLTLLPYGSVLFSTRAPIGKVGLVGSPMYCNQGFKNFICNDNLNPVYLYYTLIYKHDYLVSLGTGTTFKELSKKAVDNLEIAIPPLELQEQFECIYHQSDKSKFELRKSTEAIDRVIKSLINNV